MEAEAELYGARYAVGYLKSAVEGVTDTMGKLQTMDEDDLGMYQRLVNASLKRMQERLETALLMADDAVKNGMPS